MKLVFDILAGIILLAVYFFVCWVVPGFAMEADKGFSWTPGLFVHCFILALAIAIVACAWLFDWRNNWRS